MQDFLDWLKKEAVATTTGSGIGNNIGNDDDDGDDDDDAEWSFDECDRRFGKDIQIWIDESPTGKKIKGSILNIIFSSKYELLDPQIYEMDDRERIPDEGTVEIRVSWKHPKDDISPKLLNTLRRSDIWKVFKIQPNQLWNVLDKGQLFQYINFIFDLSLSGMNRTIAGQFHTPNQSRAKQYLAATSNWIKDKLTIGKYAGFKAHELVNSKELEPHIKDYMSMFTNKAIELDLMQEPRTRGQVYGSDYVGEATIIYRYLLS